MFEWLELQPCACMRAIVCARPLIHVFPSESAARFKQAVSGCPAAETNSNFEVLSDKRDYEARIPASIDHLSKIS